MDQQEADKEALISTLVGLSSNQRFIQIGGSERVIQGLVKVIRETSELTFDSIVRSLTESGVLAEQGITNNAGVLVRFIMQNYSSALAETGAAHRAPSDQPTGKRGIDKPAAEAGPISKGVHGESLMFYEAAGSVGPELHVESAPPMKAITTLPPIKTRPPHHYRYSFTLAAVAGYGASTVQARNAVTALFDACSGRHHGMLTDIYQHPGQPHTFRVKLEVYVPDSRVSTALLRFVERAAAAIDPPRIIHDIRRNTPPSTVPGVYTDPPAGARRFT